ncbi:MAG: alanine--tRNA ligase [Deltaproteobacteria bacterium]|nr:alanine--tRNA ligase [Deltaproteobacteria bacterium]
MDFREIRQRYLDYFKDRNHEIIASSSLVPRDDPTLLFTNAGMVQFKALFQGEEKRSYTRAATSQKCVRAGGKHNDLENVGYTSRHHTFFEMLGNFSFGDYFKRETIAWAWELLIEGFNLPKDRLWISVYNDDDEAFDIWEKETGVPCERIVRLGEKDNFWAMGDTGPCGPCSEIHIDQGEEMACENPDCGLECECDRYLEVWNLVFTQFDRDPSGRLTPLPNPSIDTGMGLERIAAVIQGVNSNYDTDLFRAIISRMEDIGGVAYGVDRKKDLSFRVISDHARAAAFLISDGVMPSNEGRGYVLRRIIRRAIRFGQIFELKDQFFHHITDKVIEIMGPDYSGLVTAKASVKGVITNEEKRFADTLFYGLRILKDEIGELKEKRIDSISGELAFKLYDTYGLSVDIVEDVAREESLKVDIDGYKKAMSGQRNQSQESWKGSGEEKIPALYRQITGKGTSLFLGYSELSSMAEVMYILKQGKEIDSIGEGDEAEVVLDRTPFFGEAGGQVGDTGLLLGEGIVFRVTGAVKYAQDVIVHKGIVKSGILSCGEAVEAKVDLDARKATALNHTATHLLHSALREVLGEHVKQAGSRVSPERLRFDFSHFTQVGYESLKEVEVLVNTHIRENFQVSTEEMSLDEAVKTGAMAIFEERYGEKVRVVSIGDNVSSELCGGTHTRMSGDLGLFKIVNESAVGANVRRIEAVTGRIAVEYGQNQEDKLRQVSSFLKTSPDKLIERVENILKEHKQKDRDIDTLKAKLQSTKSGGLLSDIEEINGVKLLTRELDVDSPKDLREYTDKIRDKLDSGIVVFGAKNDDKVMLICLVTKDLTDRFKAGDIVRQLSGIVGGKGGGRPDMAQGGGNRPEELGRALAAVKDIVKQG